MAIRTWVAYCELQGAKDLEVDFLLNPSNSRFPPPSTSGAVEIASSSTTPAARPWRIRSAPPPRETPPSPRSRRAFSSAASKPSMNRKPALGSGWSCGGSAQSTCRGTGWCRPRRRRRRTCCDRRSRAKPLGGRLVVLPVRAVHAVGVAAVVGVRPRATHHPVVEALAPDAEAVLRPVGLMM